MKRVSERADRHRKQSSVPQVPAQSRRHTGYRAAIEELESRLPPGDMLAGGWLTASLSEPNHATLEAVNRPVAATSGHVSSAALAGPTQTIPFAAPGGQQPALSESGQIAAGGSTDLRPWEIAISFASDLSADLAISPSRGVSRPRIVPARESTVVSPGQEGHAPAPRFQDRTPAVGLDAPTARAGATGAALADFLLGPLSVGTAGNPGRLDGVTGNALNEGGDPPATITSDCFVSLEPETPSPHPVGERVLWTATAEGCGERPVFQFSAGPTDIAMHMIRDYYPDNTFAWAPMEEGAYLVQVIVRESFDGPEIGYAALDEKVTPRAVGNKATVAPTANPLVALYSAPSCESGTVRVEFRPFEDPKDDRWRSTDARPCNPDRTANILVAGMRVETTYELRHVTGEDTFPSLLFTTGSPPEGLRSPQYQVAQEPGKGTDLEHGTVLQMPIMFTRPSVSLLSTDMSGRLEWFYDTLASGLPFVFGTSLVRGGTVLLQGGGFNPYTGLEILREVDLAGNVIRETNYEAINAQMAAMGLSLTNGFHHDAQRLPDGKTALLGYTERYVDINGKPTNYVGDMVLVLDEEFQVTWAWDGFEHLDVNRGPVLGDLCSGGGCSSEDPNAVDWLHSNAVAWSPADHNLIISIRHQNWVVKINYDDGYGDGSVVWRLGAEGDFTIESPDPDPWFSYQHDSRYLDDNTVVLYDNANSRCRGVTDCHSRGQMFVLDEAARHATLALNADLGHLSLALGSAQSLPGGNFVFTSGNLGPVIAPAGRSIETLADGTQTYVLESTTAWLYRSYRLTSLYERTP